MEYKTTFLDKITASNAITENMDAFTKYSNLEILPNCVDGLKLCHRRIIAVMLNNDQRMKGATLTGEVMNKLHPHGDSGIYDAIVRMGQPFSQVHPFVLIKGNFGAYGGGEYAASRYLDVQCDPFTKDLFLVNVDHRTLTYIPSETGSGLEPAYYVPRLPTSLLTGSFGVSVAYKSVIPHFNFASVCNLVDKFMELRKKDPLHYKKKYDEIAEYCIPDFPTHCYIRNKDELIKSYSQGNFDKSIIMDGILDISPQEINLRSIPHGAAFEKVFKKVGDMMNSANFISANFTEINDLTTGTEYGNLQFKLKRGVNPFDILDEFKRICTFTQSWTPIWTFVDKEGYVYQMNPMDLLEVWYIARSRSILGALKFQNIDLFKQYRKLMALIIIADHTDAVLKIFKTAENREATVPILCSKFKLTREQAEYIATLQLHQITHQGKDDLLRALQTVKTKIQELQHKFVDIDGIISEDAAELKKTYAPVCQRRSELFHFIGAILLKDYNGCIQFSSWHELAHLVHRWGKYTSYEVILYPSGKNHYIAHTPEGIVTSAVLDLPKEMRATHIEAIKLKPKSIVSLKNDTISKIDSVAAFDKKSSIISHVAGGFTAIDRDFRMVQLTTTQVPKRNNLAALGNKTNIQYFNGVYADEVVIAAVNDKLPNQIDLVRLKEGERYRYPLIGRTKIIGMWKYGQEFSFSVPPEYLSRCSIKNVMIQKVESLFEDQRKVTIFMTKHKTSNQKSLSLFAKGVDILCDVTLKGEKHER